MISGREAVQTVRAARSGEVVVTTMTGLGWWGEPGPRDFRLLGLMGAAASIGLGIAIAQPDQPVWVIDGDGSLLMQLGVLAAVADAAPERYVHVVIANGVYAVSGAQPVPAGDSFDWAGAAGAAGYRDVVTCETADELTAALGSHDVGPRMVVVRCDGAQPQFPPGSFSFDASHEGERVRSALRSPQPVSGGIVTR